ncbi:MAG: glycosyltransferase family 39 protein, partial [Anaerolineae bacterium]|nr:glycosyltransferase family 39 protein [Anaerolineae bacterium]
MNWFKTWAPKILTLLTCLALLMILGRTVMLFFDYNRTMIGFPFNADYGEGPILDQVMRLAQGKTIYPNDISQPPYIIGNYPPMYHLVQLPFALIFGPAMWYGRVVNLVSILAAAFFIGATLYTINKDWIAAIIGGLLLLTIPYILHWSGFVRVDSLALGLSWAAIYSIVRGNGNAKSLIWGAIFLSAAIYTRQSYGLAAPFASFMYLLSKKQENYDPQAAYKNSVIKFFQRISWKPALHLTLWTAGFSGLIFIFLNVITRGGFFFNIITANVNPFLWNTVKDYAQKIWTHMPVFVGGSFLFFAIAGWTKQRSWWLAAPYLIGAVISGVTIGKDGSNVNYLFELCAAFAFTTGAGLSTMGTSWKGDRWEWISKGWWAKLIGMILVGLQVLSLHAWSVNEYYAWPTNRAKNEYGDIERMVQIANEAEG